MCDTDKLHDKILASINETINKQTNDIKSYINGEIKELKEVLDLEVRKRLELEQRYEDLKRRYDMLEKGLRKNQLIIFGIETEENENSSLIKLVTDTLNSHLKLSISDCDINNIYTIEKQMRNKPVIIDFVSFLKKLEVLKNSKKLKGTKISISQVLSLEERKKNKILRQHLKEAREKNLNAYIKKNKLYIEQEEFSVEQLVDTITENEGDTELEDILEKKSNSSPSTLVLEKRNKKATEDHAREAAKSEVKKYQTRGNNASGAVPRVTTRTTTEKDAKHLKFIRSQEN